MAAKGNAVALLRFLLPPPPAPFPLKPGVGVGWQRRRQPHHLLREELDKQDAAFSCGNHV